VLSLPSWIERTVKLGGLCSIAVTLPIARPGRIGFGLP
jgi:hypothetical protein